MVINLTREDYDISRVSVSREDEFKPILYLLAQNPISDKEAIEKFESVKTEIFKGLFRRPKPEEVELDAIYRSFEPYLVVGGRYQLRYLTEREYTLSLLDNTESIYLLEKEIIVPDEEEQEEEEEDEEQEEEKKGFFENLFSMGKSSRPAKKTELDLTGVEHVNIAKEIFEACNYQQKRLNPESLEQVDFVEIEPDFLESKGGHIPSEYYDMEQFTQELVEEYTTHPDNVQRVLFEKLMLTDRKVLFYPIYWCKMIYKGSKHEFVRYDPFTDKTETSTKNKYAPVPTDAAAIIPFSSSLSEQMELTTDEGTTQVNSSVQSQNKDVNEKKDKFCPVCGSVITDDAVFCPSCGKKIKKE
jgi:hypothetical protein